MKNFNINKKVCILCFIFIISIPLALQTIGNITGKKYDFRLKGYSDIYEKPNLLLDEWISGNYQSEFSNWIDNEFATRGFYIKNYNQLRYTLLNKGSKVVGKNNDIYEPQYIETQLCIGEENDFSLTQNKEMLEEYVNSLEEIDRKLSSIGKHLLLCITPSKAHYFQENIPEKYYLERNSENAENGYDCLIKILNNTKLNYLDTNDYYSEISKSASFYPTGIHWSRPFEQVSNKRIIDMLSDCSGEKYKRIILGELKSSSTPYWRDNDVWDLLNVFTNPEVTYYEYDSSIEDVNSSKPLKVMLQGGSFSEGLMRDYFDIVMDSSYYYINYDAFVLDNNSGVKQTLTRWEDADLQTMLDESDWVIIEMNEAAVHIYSSGFVSYLNDFLDSYVQGDYSQELDDNLIPSKKKGLKRARGFWGYEESFSWTTDDSCLFLYNKSIKEKGIMIDFSVPEQIINDESVDISVFVNGNLVCANKYEHEGDYNIVISPDMINSDTDMYSIEIRSSNSFVPSQISDSSDDRLLALQVKYVGEMR